MTYSSEVLADTPQLYLRLGEPSGTTAADSSGNGRNGTYVNGPTLGATGLLVGDSNTSMFTGGNTGQAVTIPSAAWMDGLTAFSVETWSSATNAADGTNGDALVSRYGAGGFQWLLWRTTGNKFGLQAQIGGTFRNCNSTTTPATNTAYHVVGTWDGTNLRLYVNGSLEATVAASGALAASTVALEVARYSGNADTTPNGWHDEVAFYNYALSGARVAAHYAAGSSVPSITGVLAATLPMPQVAFEGAAPEVHTGTLDVVLPMPTVTFEGNNTVGTDISNRDWARRRGGIGLVTVETPVAPVPPTRTRAPRVTKAVPLPTPTMVDGRPT